MSEGKTIKSRLRDALANMGNPVKDKTAQVGRYSYKYTQLDSVLAVVKPALHDAGLFMRQRVTRMGVADWVLVLSVHSDDEDMELDVRPYYTFTDSQAQGSSETYTRRYQLMTAFGLAGEDDDGASTKGAPDQAPSNAPQKPQEPARDEFETVFINYTKALGVDAKTALTQLQLECGFDGNPRGLPPSQRKEVLEHMERRIAGAANG